jgi:hypothetical protein
MLPRMSLYFLSLDHATMTPVEYDTERAKPRIFPRS